MTIFKICALCAMPIEDDEPSQLDLEGNAAHVACLETLELDPEED